MSFPEISIIGTGGLGTSLARTFIAQEIPVKSIFNRSQAKARKLAEESGIEHWGDFPSSLNELGDLVFITVADRAIEEVAQRLSTLEGEFKGRMFVHCSGNESADLLEVLQSKGVRIASFHPLQTFTIQSGPDDFQDIYFSLQGDSEAFPFLKNIAAQLGAHTFEVTEEQKSHLHAGAVMASNYLNALFDAAVEIGSGGELPETEVKQALSPLIRTSLKNAGEHSFVESLTGPIKRGDIPTIKKHLALLEGQGELKSLYCMLGLRAVRIAETAGSLDGTTVEKMRKILR